MKPEDYFKIMDCASEKDITEMMQHRRFRQIPSGEVNAMKQSGHKEKKEIRMTRRGIATGTAVAAALLVLNIGFGGFMLHKAADDPVSSADIEVVEVSEAATETTAAITGTEENVTTAEQITAFTQTVSDETAPNQTVAETTALPAKQTPAAADKTEAPKSGKLTYSLVPADRAYESAGTNKKAPVVFHAKAGEQIKMQLKVQNDPGVAFFGALYDMTNFNLLSQTNLHYYEGIVNCIYYGGEQNSERCVLSIGGNGNGSTKAPDGAALAECTLIAPTQPGRYVVQEYVPTVNSFVVNPDGTETKITDYYYNAYADAGQTIHIDCEILGAEIIVDDAEGTQKSGIDPETAEGPTVYIGAVTAHAGQKNVPVNVYVRGCDPFVSGTLRFGYDSALKSLLYDCYAEYDSDVTEDSRLGISVDGTLLENVMTLRSSSIHGNTIMVSFNNYRAFGYDSKGIPTVFRNGETQADAAITEDGVLFTMYFDMPEECGQYRIFASEGTLGGGAQDEPGCLPNQTVQNFIPCDITVIP